MLIIYHTNIKNQIENPLQKVKNSLFSIDKKSNM